jgi:MFS family permease
MVGKIVLFFGIGYVISSLLMTRLVKRRIIRYQMLGSLAGMIVISILLANRPNLVFTFALYSLFPLVVSLFFSSFQVFILGISNQAQRPLATMVGHFTLSWSIGYALGPFISSQLAKTIEWALIYYLAAILSLVVGGLLFTIKPQKSQGVDKVDQDHTLPRVDGKRSLVVPAWIGLMAGWAVWHTMMIYRPVQAVQLNVPVQQRGLVEFTFALTQGFSALALTYLKDWQRKPAWFGLFGAIGVVGILVFGALAGANLFLIGAFLYGIFTGNMFSLAVYHAMYDESRAIQRVALNETFIGVAVLSAYLLSAWLHPVGSSFNTSYLLLAILLGTGLVAQALLAVRILRQEPVTAV